jgi:hypothetical protein
MNCSNKDFSSPLTSNLIDPKIEKYINNSSNIDSILGSSHISLSHRLDHRQ